MKLEYSSIVLESLAFDNSFVTFCYEYGIGFRFDESTFFDETWTKTSDYEEHYVPKNWTLCQ